MSRTTIGISDDGSVMELAFLLPLFPACLTLGSVPVVAWLWNHGSRGWRRPATVGVGLIGFWTLGALAAYLLLAWSLFSSPVITS
jgi:hypothetical protein